MQSKALVTRLIDNKAEIMVMRSEACGSCSACNACHAKPGLHLIENKLSAKEGDFVLVDMEDKVFFKNIAWLYVLPLILFIAGIYITGLILNNYRPNLVNKELYSLFGGFVGIFIFWIVIRLVNKRKEGEDMMTMVRISSPDEALQEICN